jgi:hypothetical protein
MPCRQLDNNRIDSAVVAVLLLLGNHLLLWIILLGGSVAVLASNDDARCRANPAVPTLSRPGAPQ